MCVQSGDDRYLSEAGIRFFITDAHAILYGTPRPRRGIYAPVITPAGVGVFARDTETSEQVWSSEIGYPGDPLYREFYRDLGYDAQDYEYIKPYLHDDGVRRNVGLKYHRITGKVRIAREEPYVPEWAMERAARTRRQSSAQSPGAGCAFELYARTPADHRRAI
jgi:1,4-alpha-glucan branching enzyme